MKSLKLTRLLGLGLVSFLTACTAVPSDPASQRELDVATTDHPEALSVPVQNGAKVLTPQFFQSRPVLTLEQAWYLALRHDKTYRAALSARAAAQTEIRQGRSAVLPKIQAGYSHNVISGSRRLHGPGFTREGRLDYDSRSAYIQLQQPLFSLESYAQFEGGKARAALGAAEFSMSEFDTAVRLADAYLETLAAQGMLELARALAASLAEQATTQDALLRYNEATQVDAQETRARLARARAEVITAEEALFVARRWLRSLIDTEPASLLSVDAVQADNARLERSLPHWLEQALVNSPRVRTATARLNVADTEVRRARGRHFPTASLIIALSNSDSENLESLGQRSNTLTVGLQLSIPIYSGGYNTAEHAGTRHELQQVTHEVIQAREQVAAEVIRRHTAVEGGAQRIGALLSSVYAAEESLKAARYGYEYGVHSNLDVLRMQDNLFRVRHELLMSRIDWLKARIGLAVLSGVRPDDAFHEIDYLLFTKNIQNGDSS